MKAIFVLLIMPFFVAAQNKSVTVFFPKGSSVPVEEEKNKIKMAIQSLNNTPRVYRFVCTGYTDSEGGEKMNQNLSVLRAKNVMLELINLGVPEKNITINGKGESEFIAENNEEENMQKNRRVNIEVTAIDYKLSSLLKKEIETQEYIINNQEGGEIIIKSGTKMVFTKNSFITEDGKIVQGDVKIKLVEYRNTNDFLIGDITMNPIHGKDDFFNSGGMMKISAEQNGREVKLDPTKGANVNFRLTDKGNFDLFQLDDQNKWNTIHAGANSHGFSAVCGSSYYAYSCNKSFGPFNPYDSALLHVYLDYTISKIKSLKQEDRAVRVKQPWITFHYKNTIIEEPASYKLEIVNRKKGIFKLVSRGRIDGLGPISQMFFRFSNKKTKSEMEELEKTIWLSAYLTQLSLDDNKVEIILNSNGKEKLLTTTVHLNKNVKGKRSKSAFRFAQNQNAYMLNQSKWRSYLDSSYRSLVIKLRRDSVCLPADSGQLFLDSAKIMKYCFEKFYEMKKAKEKPEGWKVLDEAFVADPGDEFSVEAMEKNKSQLISFMHEKRREQLKKQRELNEMALPTETLKLMADTAKGADKERLQQLAAMREQEDQLNKNFTLTGMGVWNCDQIQRMSEPMYVNAEFRDVKGKSLDIVKVYLVIDHLNGVITYQNSYGPSTANFPLEKNKKQRMIVIATDMKIYSVSTENVKAALSKKSANTLFISAEFKDGISGSSLAQN